ncbi:6-phosphogluconolactonase [Acrasis kona]|uniref:6-phosphogluconolactonase n=1 Tax=Acrasis kona TaxID=1008807 RepID=A0AAW2YSJ2_9EUKA
MRTVYIGTWSSYLYVLDLDLEKKQITLRESIDVGVSPSWITLNKSKTILYTVNESDNFKNEQGTGGILSFAIGSDGSLKQITETQSLGVAPCHMSIDKDEQFLTVANYMGTLATFETKDGLLKKEPIQVIKNEGSGPHDRQESSHPHSFVFSPDQKFAFLCDLGLDKVFQYKYNSNTGELVPNQNETYIKVQPGFGPRHISFHPNCKHAYLLNELNSSLIVCDYNDENGTLTEKQSHTLLPDGAKFEDNLAGEVEVTPDGKFLYATNRGDADSIAIFSILDDGNVSFVSHQRTGKYPRHFAIENDVMLVVNQNQDRLQLFERNTDSGLLIEKSSLLGLEKPVCVIIL